MNTDYKILKSYLDQLYKTYDIKYLDSDPLKFVHRYESHQNKEIVALISAALAYGNVKQIFVSVEKVLNILGTDPHTYIKNFDPYSADDELNIFKHRFNTGKDISVLFYFLKQIYEQNDTMGDYFYKGYKDSDTTVENALSYFISGILSLDCSPFYKNGLPKDAGVRYFLTSPENQSACKRMNLFLRWMVRTKDDVDCGLWTKVKPSKLVIPLDTHTARLCRYIGLTDKKNTSWKMAEEVTQKLRIMEPEDPIKYDFALCRLGILDICLHKYKKGVCENCMIFDICSIAAENK